MSIYEIYFLLNNSSLKKPKNDFFKMMIFSHVENA